MVPSSRVELLPPVGSSPERAGRLSLSDIHAVLVHCYHLEQHCLAGYFSCLDNFLAVLFALYCLLFRFVLFVDAVGVFVVAAQVVAFCRILDTLEDIFLGIVVAFTGKHSLAGYFLVVNSYFSCFQHTVRNVRQYETVISVYFHCCKFLLLLLIVSLSTAKLLVFSNRESF